MRLEHLPADVFGLSPYARAALAGRPRPPQLEGLIVPAALRDVPRPEERFDTRDRHELALSLETALSAFEPHVRVLDSVRALRAPGAVLVVAGQQPAFLGGPLYDVCKALHAIRLARALAEAWGCAVVPAFWNHADDHDVAEVHHLWIQTPSLELRKLGLRGASSGKRPLSRIIYDEERHALRATAELLRSDLFVAPGREQELDLFLPRDGESFSNAFTRLLLHLFGRHGLVVIEPDWIRPVLSRHLAELVVLDVRGELERGAASLAARGLPVAIDPTQAALVFHLRQEERHALRSVEGGFRFDEEPGSRTATELAAEIVQAPAEYAPGGLLRPLVQDLALPVCAYVGGWGELGYHAQIAGLRRRAGAPSTPFVPRLSVTLVDPETRAACEKLGVSVEDVLRAGGHLGETADPAQETPAVVAKLRSVGVRATEDLAALRDELAQLDRGLAAQIRRTAQRIEEALETLAGKAERVHANASGRGRHHLRRLNQGLVPRGEPQERVRGAVEFVPRFGTGWLDELLAEIDPFPAEHLVLYLEDPSKETSP